MPKKTVSTYLAIDNNGDEVAYCIAEDRMLCRYNCPIKYNFVPLKPGTIFSLVGRNITEPFLYFTKIIETPES